MAQTRVFRRSTMERLIAIGTTLISLALLGWVTVDIFNSTILDRPTAKANQVFELARRQEPVIVAKMADEMSKTAPDQAVIDTQPTAGGTRDMAHNLVPEPVDESQTASGPAPDGHRNRELERELEAAKSALEMAEQRLAVLQSDILAGEQRVQQLAEASQAEIGKLQKTNDELLAAKVTLEAELAQTAKSLASVQWKAREQAKQIASYERENETEAVTAEQAVPPHQQAQAAYRQGRFREAAEIWTALAENGDPKAQFHLGSLQFEGKLGNVDLPAAYRQLTMAASGGFGPALAMRERVRQAMTADELAAANRGI